MEVMDLDNPLFQESFSDESDTSAFSEKDFKESEINLETN